VLAVTGRRRDLPAPRRNTDAAGSRDMTVGGSGRDPDRGNGFYDQGPGYGAPVTPTRRERSGAVR
jgi:hypothetical protein